MTLQNSSAQQLPDSIQNVIRYLIESGLLKKIVLFGSRARGAARENSDFDFAIWLSDKNQWPRLKADIEEKNLTLLPLDLSLYDELSEAYRLNIDREGLVIYEAA